MLNLVIDLLTPIFCRLHVISNLRSVAEISIGTGEVIGDCFHSVSKLFQIKASEPYLYKCAFRVCWIPECEGIWIDLQKFTDTVFPVLLDEKSAPAVGHRKGFSNRLSKSTAITHSRSGNAAIKTGFHRLRI